MARLETATKAGFAVLLLGLSLLLAFGLQPGSKPAAVTTVVQTVNSPEGAILVLVEVSDGEGGHSPGVGVGVGITQLQVGGIRATLQTNHTGQAWFPAPAGSYGVGVSDPRFAVSGKANVTGGKTTLFFVEVNRTAYGVGFADVKEVSQGGGVLPTGRIDLEVGQEVTFVSLG
ncbi:MAG TPA: hypothetical protein VEB67_00510, partial [Nitrososphaerales archaeon]|nr:hypothetical protein [Nitrososphaerales archaeon]